MELRYYMYWTTRGCCCSAWVPGVYGPTLFKWLESCRFQSGRGLWGDICSRWWSRSCRFGPSPNRAGTSVAPDGRRGTGRCRRGGPAGCWGWSGRSRGGRWGRWSARTRTAPQSTAGTRTCSRPWGGTARRRRWSWPLWPQGCPRSCVARDPTGTASAGASLRCALRCNWSKKQFGSWVKKFRTPHEDIKVHLSQDKNQ